MIAFNRKIVPRQIAGNLRTTRAERFLSKTESLCKKMTIGKLRTTATHRQTRQKEGANGIPIR
jgi:hypothetical protein